MISFPFISTYMYGVEGVTWNMEKECENAERKIVSKGMWKGRRRRKVYSFR